MNYYAWNFIVFYRILQLFLLMIFFFRFVLFGKRVYDIYTSEYNIQYSSY
jgi:hypothetical protein